MLIPRFVNKVSEQIAEATLPFVQTKLGKVFLGLVLLGPLTFLPTVYTAWTAENIDSLRTLTWPMMVVVNTSSMLGAIHKGCWRMRLVMIFWIIEMAAIFLATIIR